MPILSAPLFTPFKSVSIVAISLLTISISGCGGSDADKTSDKINHEYERIENQVKEEYKRVENKLTNNEKSMAEILKSVFLPEQSLDTFLDKITPEGGLGGLYVGHFVELDDGNDSDIDIGAIYFDISKDAAGSVDGRVSYQQQPCQNNRTLATDTAVKVNNNIVGKLSGSLDTPKFLDMKYINKLDIRTPNLLSTFAGSFNEKMTGQPWTGSFEYQDGLGGKTLSSGIDDCDVLYTLGGRANYVTYPLDYRLGDMQLDVVNNTVQWQNPADTALVLVSQIDIEKAKSGDNGFERNQIFQQQQTQFSPVITLHSTNYAFVVQAFDKNNALIGYQAIVMDLPIAK
ncbi:hypothetical protein [Psychrobacter sp. I-STPA10]|uniref:hypothetical protein n=1 Tax=Psychrobacter sp. I-STPA10 TaxID=2585769 RepID=UPI001E2CDB23|nr:hypothetical protein [Psychrobacter sp. I-STPA10]